LLEEEGGYDKAGHTKIAGGSPKQVVCRPAGTYTKIILDVMPTHGPEVWNGQDSSTDELHGTVQGCPKAYAAQASAHIQQPLAEFSSFDQPSVLSQPVMTREVTGVLHPIYFVLVSNHNTRIIQRQMLPILSYSIK
jgi:hypothetical protein